MQQDHFSSPKETSDLHPLSKMHRPVRVDISTPHRNQNMDEIVRPDRIVDREMEEPERWDGMS